MVGLVLVSHSRALVEGAAQLVQGMSTADIPVAISGGAGEDRRELGTDPLEIMEAIQQVDDADGVLVLMDLGSAILSAETALEFLEGTLAGPVRLVPAPLVEGALSAAVQIAVGADLETVVAEALDSLAPKQEQLGAPASTLPAAAPPAPGADAYQQETYRVDTEHGIHARPAAELVRTIGRFDAEAEVRRVGDPGHWVNGRSLNRIATLQVRCGDSVEVRARGPEAGDLLAAVRKLVRAHFGEEAKPADASAKAGGPPLPSPGPVPPRSDLPSRAAQGLPASPGRAEGEVIVLHEAEVAFSRGEPEPRPEPLSAPEVAEQWRTVEPALRELALDYRGQAREARQTGRISAAEIAEAHETLLLDPEWHESSRVLLRDCDVGPLEAFWKAGLRIAAEYRRMQDAYLRDRAADVEDVARRLVATLRPDLVREPTLPEEPAILVADDFLPSQALHFEPDRVRALVSVHGSENSHVAILARGLGIPMVAAVPLSPGWEGELPGREAIVDGSTGLLELDPEPANLAEVAREREERREREAELRTLARQPAHLADGSPLPILANVATLADARTAADNGAEGIGLLRTEFLFLGRDPLPREDEQVEALRERIELFGDQPVTLRLLDIGGDKELPALHLPPEANPFLGLRGIRLLRHPDHAEMLRGHLRAILRAGAGRRLRLMIPMVTHAAEVEAIRSLLATVRTELERTTGEPPPDPPLGIMVETPAAVLRAADLARVSDFFSVGTNDLSQYVMAAERGNPAMTTLADPLQPAVLQALQWTAEAARAAGIPLGLCGELASRPEALPLLVGLGFDSLSVSPALVPLIKFHLQKLDPATCRERLPELLAARDRATVGERLSGHGT
mgnify:FL=1